MIFFLHEVWLIIFIAIIMIIMEILISTLPFRHMGYKQVNCLALSTSESKLFLIHPIGRSYSCNWETFFSYLIFKSVMYVQVGNIVIIIRFDVFGWLRIQFWALVAFINPLKNQIAIVYIESIIVILRTSVVLFFKAEAHYVCFSLLRYVKSRLRNLNYIWTRQKVGSLKSMIRSFIYSLLCSWPMSQPQSQCTQEIKWIIMPLSSDDFTEQITTDLFF